jgi:hypothetical protein
VIRGHSEYHPSNTKGRACGNAATAARQMERKYVTNIHTVVRISELCRVAVHLPDLGIDGKKLKRTREKLDVRVPTVSIKGPVEGSCEQGNEHSGSIQFLELPE